MFNRKSILVSTDLSQKSEMAVEKASNLAARYDKWLEILHVIDTPIFEWAWGSELLEKHQKELAATENERSSVNGKIAAKLTRKSEKMNIDTRIGTPTTEILEYAKHKDVELIVLGDSGEYHPFAKFVVGTTAKKVIQKSHLPVLITKNNGTMEYNKILIPVDMTDITKETIKFVREFFKDTKITLLYIIEPLSNFRLSYYGLESGEIEEIKNMHDAKSKKDFESFVESVKEHDSVEIQTIHSSICASEIVKYAKENSFDLIAMSAHDINDMSSKIIGNIAAEVLEETEIDTLIYQG